MTNGALSQTQQLHAVRTETGACAESQLDGLYKGPLLLSTILNPYCCHWHWRLGLCRNTWDVIVAPPLVEVEAVHPQRLHNTDGSLSNSPVMTCSLRKEHMLPSAACVHGMLEGPHCIGN